MATDLGQCLDMTDDLPLRYKTATQRTAVANAIVRALQNDTGYLARINPAYAPERGYNLRALLNGGLSPARLAAVRSRIAQEATADERVLDAEVTATLTQGVLDVEIAVTTAAGPFRLVIAVTSSDFTSEYFET
jgi:hypothetical protein